MRSAWVSAPTFRSESISSPVTFWSFFTHAVMSADVTSRRSSTSTCLTAWLT